MSSVIGNISIVKTFDSIVDKKINTKIRKTIPSVVLYTTGSSLIPTELDKLSY